MNVVETLKSLMLVPGISGREDKIREAIIKEVTPYASEVSVDKLGNVIARKGGKGKKIMFCAHMDEIGFFVNYIEPNGCIRVSGVGAINRLAASYSYVISEKGVCGVIVPEGDGVPEMDKMYIDIGAKTKKQAEKKVSVGDFFICQPSMKKLMGNRYVGRPFDNRVGCAIMIEALREMKETENDVYFVFSTQEEVGSRGAKPAAYAISPDIGIALDVTMADKPGVSNVSMKMGEGCTIKIKDAGAISSPRLVSKMKEIAKANKVKYQDEILLQGGTDHSVIQITGTGAEVSAISIATAFIHTGVEMIDMDDVKNAVQLTARLAEEL